MKDLQTRIAALKAYWICYLLLQLGPVFFWGMALFCCYEGGRHAQGAALRAYSLQP